MVPIRLPQAHKLCTQSSQWTQMCGVTSMRDKYKVLQLRPLTQVIPMVSHTTIDMY